MSDIVNTVRSYIPNSKKLKIPKGKKVSIMNASITSPIVNVPLVLEQEVTISLSSSFSPMFGGGGGNLGKWINRGGAISSRLTGVGFSSRFKQFGLQEWESTDPVSVNLTFTFFVGLAGKYDAYQEVYKPMITLAKLLLPGEGDLGVLIAPGPTILETVDKTVKEAEESEGFIGEATRTVQSFLSVDDSPSIDHVVKHISVRIGKILYLPSVIVLKAEPTFSNETDENGYPIWGQISLDIQSIETATVELLSME